MNFQNKSDSVIRNFVIWWNNNFTIDYWYRQKYKIPYNSKKHRELSPLDLVVEWEEEQVKTIIKNEYITERQTKDYHKTGRWLVERVEEIPDDFYDSMDWSEFDDK